MDRGEGKGVRVAFAAVLVAALVGAGVVVLVVAVPACGAVHVRLVNAGSSGPLYECDKTACQPAQTDDPARKNLDRMDLYTLPEGCVELASAAVLPSGPGVDLACGPGGTKSYRCEGGTCTDLPPGTPPGGAGTVPIQLPSDCGGRIHEVIVVNATTDQPTVYVECDASSGGLEEM
jgi:hypothetical protein